MKTAIIIICYLITVCIGTVWAQMDEDENVIGLYFDETGETDCLTSVPTHSQIPCYIVLTRPTFSDLYGFELGFQYSSELIHLGTTFENDQALNFGSEGNLIVGFGIPTYTSDATLLATLNMMYVDVSNTPASLILSGASPSSLDSAYPAVLLAEGEVISTALHDPVFPHQMNGVCEFEDRDAAWSEVKSIYR
ncbi:MAG: hypothetical protein GY780_02080 [bacterium]|nr:hypothetical protein [bacterium]